jgi:hypothetical protein
VVSASLEEGVHKVGQVGDHTVLLRLAKGSVVPLTQPITARHSLALGVHVQDVVIPLHMNRVVRRQPGQLFRMLLLYVVFHMKHQARTTCNHVRTLLLPLKTSSAALSRTRKGCNLATCQCAIYLQLDIQALTVVQYFIIKHIQAVQAHPQAS